MREIIRGVSLLFIFAATGGIAQNTFPSSGNVGVGTASPSNPLTISTSMASGNIVSVSNTAGGGEASIIYQSSGGPSWVAGNGSWGVTGDYVVGGGTTWGPKIVIDSSGKVGIGTIAPSYELEVDQTPSSDIPIFALSNALSPSGANQTHGLSVLSPNAVGTGTLDSTIETGTSRTLMNAGYMAFVSNGAGSASNFLTFGIFGSDRLLNIETNGNIGIGTASPGAKLEVNGNIALSSGSGASMTFADGTVQSTAWNGVLSGGDYAESVDVAGDRARYEPGDVLVIDTTSEGSFQRSSQPYSTSVTGIYSTRPGLVGRRQLTARSHMKAEVPMAMTGIVPIKVSAENGQIKPGDLLVTSSTPGYAMKGTDRTQMLGAVIGKAIGHLDSGVGVIEAVVTLQ